MILKLAYDNKTKSFYESVKELLENYQLVELLAFNEDNYATRKEAFKLKACYGTRLLPFMVLSKEDNSVIEAFYSDNNSCRLDYLKDVLDHCLIYNHEKYVGLDRSKETERNS